MKTAVMERVHLRPCFTENILHTMYALRGMRQNKWNMAPEQRTEPDMVR